MKSTYKPKSLNRLLREIEREQKLLSLEKKKDRIHLDHLERLFDDAIREDLEEEGLL